MIYLQLLNYVTTYSRIDPGGEGGGKGSGATFLIHVKSDHFEFFIL